jgi:hypothetical protein
MDAKSIVQLIEDLLNNVFECYPIATTNKMLHFRTIGIICEVKTTPVYMDGAEIEHRFSESTLPCAEDQVYDITSLCHYANTFPEASVNPGLRNRKLIEFCMKWHASVA